MILSEYQNIKTFFAKGYTPNWSEKDFVIKKVKNLFRGRMLLVILKEKNCFSVLQKRISKNKSKRI